MCWQEIEGLSRNIKFFGSTFHCNIDTRCKKQSPKAIVEDLITLQGCCGMIGDLNT